MAWPKNTDPEARLQIELNGLMKAAGIVSILATERQSPRTEAIIMGADETRMAIPHTDPDTGKKCRWQQFEVTIDLVGDGKTPVGTLSKAASKMFLLFDDSGRGARNARGIFTATLQKDKGAVSSEGELKNPFMVRCDTFTELE